MLQLNGENVQKGWEDYKGFLEGLGMTFENAHRNMWLTHIEQAFKMGFATGAASKKQEEPAAAPPETKKKTHKRGKLRAPSQVEHEGAIISSILEAKGRAMQLMDIVEAAKRKGVNWYPKSASGYMIRIMKTHPEIKKVSTGMYAYVEQ